MFHYERLLTCSSAHVSIPFQVSSIRNTTRKRNRKTPVVDGWKADRGGGMPGGLGREQRHGRVDENRRTAAAVLITVTA